MNRPDQRLQDLAREWDQFGREDPLWAVLTDRERRQGGWDEQSFFATGEEEIAATMTALGRFDLPRRTVTAIDFGCGAGRLSRALASRFDEVTGIDVSESMVEEARRHSGDVAGLRFVVNRQTDLSFIPDQSVDLVYSNITLQHIPPPLNVGYLREFFRVLAPGGAAVFHVPTGTEWNGRGIVFKLVPNAVLNPIRRRYYHTDAVMEMHRIKESTIRDVITAAGCQLLEVALSDKTGYGWVIKRFIARRPPSSGT